MEQEVSTRGLSAGTSMVRADVRTRVRAPAPAATAARTQHMQRAPATLAGAEARALVAAGLKKPAPALQLQDPLLELLQVAAEQGVPVFVRATGCRRAGLAAAN